MKENDIKKLMWKYLNGTITEAEEQLLEEFDSNLLAKNRDSIFKSKHHARHIKQVLHSNIYKKTKVNRQRNWIGIAASFAIILSLGIFALNFSNKPIKDKPIAQITKTTDWGQKLDVVLSDGTKIRLNSGSTLQFPETFTGATREVTLKGEAFFEVVEYKDRPFIVKSANTTTTVLGTSFNINGYAHAQAVTVTLTEGKVKMRAKDSTIFLNPNEQAVFNKTYKTLNTFPVNVKPYIDWKNGIIHITDATMAETAKVLVNFVLEDEKLGNCHITATYDNQTLATVIEIIRYVKKDVKFEHIAENKILIRGNCTEY